MNIYVQAAGRAYRRHYSRVSKQAGAFWVPIVKFSMNRFQTQFFYIKNVNKTQTIIPTISGHYQTSDMPVILLNVTTQMLLVQL